MALLLALVLVLTRGLILRSAGGWLIDLDPVRQVDYAVMTPESGLEGEFEGLLLFEGGGVRRLAVLVPRPKPVERELARRGLTGNATVERLTRLGVPPDHIVLVDASEGGTTDATAALTAWLLGQPGRTAVIITSVTHSHRFKRALARRWPPTPAPPSVHASRFDGFRAEDWWQRRTTLRAGLVELQKLALDYVSHPLDW